MLSLDRTGSSLIVDSPIRLWLPASFYLRHDADLLETRIQQTARTKDIRQEDQGFGSQGCQRQVTTYGEVMPRGNDQDTIFLKQRLALDSVGFRRRRRLAFTEAAEGLPVSPPAIGFMPPQESSEDGEIPCHVLS